MLNHRKFPKKSYLKRFQFKSLNHRMSTAKERLQSQNKNFIRVRKIILPSNTVHIDFVNRAFSSHLNKHAVIQMLSLYSLFSTIICVSSAYFYVTNFSSLSTLCAKHLYFLVFCVRNGPNREHLFSNFQQNARAKHKTKPSVMKGDFHRLILVVKLFLFDVFYSFHFLVMSDFGHLTFFALCKVIATALKCQ